MFWMLSTGSASGMQMVIILGKHPTIYGSRVSYFNTQSMISVNLWNFFRPFWAVLQIISIDSFYYPLDKTPLYAPSVLLLLHVCVGYKENMLTDTAPLHMGKTFGKFEAMLKKGKQKGSVTLGTFGVTDPANA